MQSYDNACGGLPDGVVPSRPGSGGSLATRDITRETRVLHAGYGAHGDAGPFLPGPQFSSTYSTPGDPATHALTYGRFHNPTWFAWETALGVLDRGQAVAFSSGMAAMAAVFGVSLKPGDVVVLPSDSYYSTRVVATGWWTSMG